MASDCLLNLFIGDDSGLESLSLLFDADPIPTNSDGLVTYLFKFSFPD